MLIDRTRTSLRSEVPYLTLSMTFRTRATRHVGICLSSRLHPKQSNQIRSMSRWARMPAREPRALGIYGSAVPGSSELTVAFPAVKLSPENK